MSLLKWALIFLCCFDYRSRFWLWRYIGGECRYRPILFFIFVVIFVVLLIMGLVAARQV